MIEINYGLKRNEIQKKKKIELTFWENIIYAHAFVYTEKLSIFTA